MLFLIKKLVGSFVIYPGLSVTFGVLALLLWFKRRKLAFFFAALSVAFLYFFSTEFGKDLTLKPLEDAYPYPKLSSLNCTYIVVLGGGIVPHSPAAGGRATVRPQVAKRLLEAWKLWRVLKKPIVATGGVLYPNVESEAAVMARFLEGLGVPASQIKVEGKSRTTFENAEFTYRLIGPQSICLVTSAYHMPRSVRIFKSFGFKVTPVPTDYRVNRAGYNWLSFMPIYGVDTYFGFREWVGIAFFELRNLWRAPGGSNLPPTD